MTIARAVALLFAAGGLAAAQPPGQPARDGPRPAFESTTTAVLVDVVVRDGDGRVVRDLRAGDFEIREDGVPQAIGSFTRVSRGGGIGISVGFKDPNPPTMVGPPPSAENPAAGEASPHPAVTALVFDALSADAVNLCQRAAFDYIPMSGTLGARVGVFTTEPAVRALQRYTDDPALVRQAVRRVLPTGTSLKDVQAEKLAAVRERQERLDTLGAPETMGQGGETTSGSGIIGQVEIERRLVQSERRMLRSFEALDRDQRGFGTTSALMAIVQSLVDLPGRKTLVFFSEGLPASPALQAHLQSVVEAANRVNVTVYAVDASGLRVLSGTGETRTEIEEAGKERMRQLGSRSDGTEEPIMRLVERTEDLVRFDSQSGLARLAEQTGGFLVRDTNDLRQAFRRIDEDMRFHYLLTYTPSRQVFDGGFRAIAVKVNRPGLEVFTRKGYRALRYPPAATTLDYEGPALAALDAVRPPSTFPIAVAALSFPEAKRPGLIPLVVRVKTGDITYDERPGDQAYSADVTIVARFRDPAGALVHKVSQQYQLNGRLTELDAARKGQILFYREPELPAGLYTVETVVFDGVGNRASAKVATLEVPRAEENELRVSSVVLVRDVEQVTRTAEEPSGPLYVGNMLLYPNGGDPYSRSADRELTFYYAVYPRRGARALPTAAVELRRGGQSLARLPVTLAEPGPDGRIQQVGRLPLRPLANGTYELRVTIGDGAAAIERTAFFTVGS